MKATKLAIVCLCTLLAMTVGQALASGDLLPEYGPLSEEDISKKIPCTGIEYNGYVAAGGIFNTRGTYNSVAFAENRNEFSLSAAYIALCKGAETNGCGTAWGFQTDFMFGSEYRYMRTISGLDQGLNTSDDGYYGFAIPNLYLMLAYNYWTFKLGHFDTPLGYEALRSDERFFYSTSYSFDYMPAGHTGILAEYGGFENLDITLGWVMGDDTGFATDYGQSTFISSFCYHFSEKSSLTIGMELGRGKPIIEASEVPEGFCNATDELILSMVYKLRLNEKWGYVMEVDYANYNTPNVAYAKFTTFNNMLFYTMNDKLKFGARIEWLWGTNSTQMWEMTWGVNWSPKSWLTVRPELRYDSANFEMFNDRQSRDQLMLGFDVVATF